jgi:hypothetical protein
MASTDLDRLLDDLARLTPAQREVVRARMDHLESAKAGSRFGALVGVVSEADAALMQTAVEDCERIDPRGW